MMNSSRLEDFPVPTIIALGDRALVVRFGDQLSDKANLAAIALSTALDRALLPTVVEVVPNLVSVLVRYDPLQTSYQTLAGEIRLVISLLKPGKQSRRCWQIDTMFDGPDINEVAGLLDLTVSEFILAHAKADLRVMATGFAPGFVYCGMHENILSVPRRTRVRPMVPAGSVLFAAGQTAIAATSLPTGWHVIGHTDFANFNPMATPPTSLQAGDRVQFTAA